MNLWLAAIAALSVALAGVGLLRILWPSRIHVPVVARLAIGFSVGTFLVALLFFGAFVLGVSFSRGWLFAIVEWFAFLGLISCKGHYRKNADDRHFTEWLLPGTLCLLALALSWCRPVYGYDALSMWALKAKMAFYARTWPATMFDPHTTHHTEYPPLVPSAQAFVFFWLNAFDDVASRIVFASFFASGAIVLWWFLKVLRASSRGVCLLWWCALPLLMEQVKTSYADVVLAAFILVFFGALVAWLREPQAKDWLWLAAIFGGMAFWVKQDALIGVGGGYAALVIVAWNRKLPLRFVGEAIAISAFIACPWPLFVWWKKLPTDFAFPRADIGGRLLLISREMLKAAFVEGGYAFFWPVFTLTILFGANRLKKSENLLLMMAIVFGVCIILVVYLSSVLPLAPHLQTSTERVLLSLFVPALLLVALLWRSSLVVLRRANWQNWAALGVMATVVAGVWIGLHRKSSEELGGIAISPLPVLLSWIWLAVAIITLWKFLPRLRHAHISMAWRATQFAVVMATFGLAAVSIGVCARDFGECWRRYGTKTLEQKHALSLDPAVKEGIAVAERKFPRGTHVRVTPKRSLRYHQFHYETFPDLVVDDSATNVVTFTEP